MSTQVSPTTGEPLSPVAWTSVEEIPAIIERARAAQSAWSAKSLSERSRAIRDLAQAVLAGHEEIATILSQETGKSFDEALLNEISGIADYAKMAIREAEAALAPVRPAISRTAYPGKSAVIEAVPRGVVGIIAPWNYPLSIFYKPLFPALLSGNAVVLKPSEFTPRTGAWLAARCQEVLGADLVGLVQGAGREGAALLEGGIDAVTFTGSVPTGRKIAARAGELLIPASVELGGKDAAIVLADCDLDRTAAGITQWALHNCGQNCAAIERVYVEESIADAFAERLAALFKTIRVAPAEEGHSDISPLQNEMQLSIVKSHVEDALDKGAKILAGGEPTGRGLGFQATCLDHCDESMLVVTEETFGPLVAICRVKDADEAVRRANASPYGLNGSVWTRDIRRGEAIARRLNVGIALVNNHAIGGMIAGIPWTGTGDTGPGIAASRFSYPTFVRRKTIFIDKNRAPDPWWFPFNDDSRELANHLIAFSSGSLTAVFGLAGAAKKRLRAVQAWSRASKP